MHLGTNIKTPELYKLSLERLYYFSNIMKKIGVDIRFFDIGGGMPNYMNSEWERSFINGIYSVQDLISDFNKTIIIEPVEL